MTKLQLHDPALVNCQWIPTGRNSMDFLNRHLGSHKRYKAPTEFGMPGSVQQLKQGAFTLEGHGFYLYPKAYSPSAYLQAELSGSFADSRKKGVELDKDGICLYGMQFGESLDAHTLKRMIALQESEFNQYFLQILTERQKELLCSAYSFNGDQSSFRPESYALIITDDIGVQISNAESFMDVAANKDLLAPVTDWVINYFTLEDCHIFIGVKAMVCVGQPSVRMRKLLKHLLQQKTLNIVAQQMYDNLWRTTTILLRIGTQIPSASYKKLERFNKELYQINDNFSRQSLLNEMMKAALENKQEAWEAFLESNTELTSIKTGDSYLECTEKAEDRNRLIQQLAVDIQGLRNQLQQRISLIMTKNGQELNLTLLLLTLISVLGIEAVFDLTTGEIILVLVVLLPFLYFTIRSFLYYHYQFHDRRASFERLMWWRKKNRV